MEWAKEFELGHQELDAEHRALLDLINRIEDGVAAGLPLEVLEQLLRDLEQAAERHFAREEQLIAEIDFPGREGHATLHRMLLASLRDWVQDVSFGTSSAESIVAFLTHWFASHTSEEDQELVAYLAGQDARRQSE